MTDKAASLARIPRDKWVWYGNAAHLIVGQWCRFHLATKVGDYLVSTVGEYVHPSHSGGGERTESEWLSKPENQWGAEIGCGRKFETMVFKIDGECECGCGLPSCEWTELDSDGYNHPKDATEGHYRMCDKVAAGRIGWDA